MTHLEQLIAHLELALPPAGAAGNNARNSHVLAVLLKLGSYAFELSGHFDFKGFLLLGREVLTVRVKGRGIGIDEVAKIVRSIHGLQPVEPLVVNF